MRCPAEPAQAPRSSAKEFAALQQHIDELTQQKFEAQRGIAAQQRVADELSEENKSLAEDFNRQVLACGCCTVCTWHRLPWWGWLLCMRWHSTGPSAAWAPLSPELAAHWGHGRHPADPAMLHSLLT